MALVELGRPVQRRLRPDRRQVLAERRCGATAPYASCSASDGRRVPPDHQVGVGAQPGDVVDAAHHHVLLGQLLEQRLDLAARAPRAARGSGLVGPEHRPHRVPDGVVESPRRRALGLPRRHRRLPDAPDDLSRPRPPTGHAGRDADPVVRRAGQRQARCAASAARRRRPGPGGRPRTAAARRPSAAPCSATTSARPAGQRAQLGHGAATSSASPSLQQPLLAEPADAGAHRVHVGVPGVGDPLAQPPPLRSRSGSPP